MIAAQPAFHRMAPEASQDAALRRSAWAAVLSLLLHGLAVAAMIGVVLRPEAPKGEAVFTVELVSAATAAAGVAPSATVASTAPAAMQPVQAATEPVAASSPDFAESPPEPLAVDQPEQIASQELMAEAAPLPEWKPKPRPRPSAPATAEVKSITPPAETPMAQVQSGAAAAPPAEPAMATAQSGNLQERGQQGAGSQLASAAAGSSEEPPVITEPRFRVPPHPPEYPPRARAMEQQGISVVRALVDTDGTSREIRLWRSSGFHALDRAALVAVRGWRFEAARRGEQPVLAWVEIPIRFEIR